MDEIQELNNKIKEVKYIHIVLLHKGTAIGKGCLTVYKDKALISGILVREDFKGEGYSKQLMDYLERKVKKQFDRNEVYLFCDQNDWVTKMYEKRGYKIETYFNDTQNRELYEGRYMVWMVKKL